MKGSLGSGADGVSFQHGNSLSCPSLKCGLGYKCVYLRMKCNNHGDLLPISMRKDGVLMSPGGFGIIAGTRFEVVSSYVEYQQSGKVGWSGLYTMETFILYGYTSEIV